MQRKLIAGLAGPIVLLGAACAADPPPVSTAAGVERIQCGAATIQDRELNSLQALAITVEPLYAHIMTGNNNAEDRVRGAKVVVRPPPNVSAEELTRALQCHSARILLGKVDGSRLSDDPFWLENSWINIDVKPENGNYAILLEADSVSKNLKLLARAQAFVGSRSLSL